MSAPEQPQGVLLRYHGGTVYALARPVAGLLWRVTVAGVELRCRLDASTIPGSAWLRVTVDLATLAALPIVQRRVDVMTAARVINEVQCAHAATTGKGKRRVDAKGER